MKLSSTYPDILQAISRYRKYREMTQELMASKLNLSLNAYARLERGETQLHWQRLLQIVDILQIDLEKLITSPCEIDFLNQSKVQSALLCEHCGKSCRKRRNI